MCWFFFLVLLDDYVRPHGYEFDEEYMTYGVVPSILGALGVFSLSVTEIEFLKDVFFFQ